jgi:hypothetical protein
MESNVKPSVCRLLSPRTVLAAALQEATRRCAALPPPVERGGDRPALLRWEGAGISTLPSASSCLRVRSPEADFRGERMGRGATGRGAGRRLPGGQASELEAREARRNGRRVRAGDLPTYNMCRTIGSSAMIDDCRWMMGHFGNVVGRVLSSHLVWRRMTFVFKVGPKVLSLGPK